MAKTEHKASIPQKDIKILIATPCYNGLCHAGYTLSLVKTFAYFQQFKNVKLSHKFILYESLVPRARNHFTAFALSDPAVTHLLFIDSDIKWEPEDVAKLLIDNKPIVAATFPKKRYIWEKLRDPKVQDIVINKNLTAEEFKEKIKANIVEYAINFGSSREVKDGMIEVDHVATAFMMIQREALEHMAKTCPELKVKNPSKEISKEAGEHLYCFFELALNDGEYLSEDYSFCRRWLDIGGKIYADLTINLTHSGAEEFEGNFLSVTALRREPL